MLKTGQKFYHVLRRYCRGYFARFCIGRNAECRETYANNCCLREHEPNTENMGYFLMKRYGKGLYAEKVENKSGYQYIYSMKSQGDISENCRIY